MSTSLLEDSKSISYQPLAARMRPQKLGQVVGQVHLLGPGKPLYEALNNNALHSMILWGPPGVGKTTLAKLIAASGKCHFESLSAVLAGVKEIRETIEQAKFQQSSLGQLTVLFVDEVHRFNKSQQDAFLPHIENGTIIFIGATTENPSFELNNALLSRTRVYLLKNLSQKDLVKLIDMTLSSEHGLREQKLVISNDHKLMLAKMADGDARQALNLLEILADMTEPDEFGERQVVASVMAQLPGQTGVRFDKAGDDFYQQISALHKSVRGSAPDAALYWLSRMLDGGCDPVYIARRLVRMASEDIGNADPKALEITLNCWDTHTRLGSPEGELALAQAVVYLSCTAKSNAVYTAFTNARTLVSKTGSLPVPLHLCNASTTLAKQIGHGEEYRYAHDEDQAYAAGENYLPEEIKDTQLYFPTEYGLEQKMKQRLEYFRSLDANSKRKRYD